MADELSLDQDPETAEAPAVKDALAAPLARTLQNTMAPVSDPKVFEDRKPDTFESEGTSASYLTPAAQASAQPEADKPYSAGRKGIIEMYERVGKERGYSPFQVYGLLGNKIAESGLNPGAINPNDSPRSRVHRDSIGFGQWNDTRAIALRNLAKSRGVDWRDPLTQVIHTYDELEGVESRAGDMLRNSRNVREAALAGIAYERPKGFTWGNPSGGHNWSGRLGSAVKLAGGTNPYADDTRAFASEGSSGAATGGVVAGGYASEESSSSASSAGSARVASASAPSEPSAPSAPASPDAEDPFAGGGDTSSQEEDDNPFDNKASRGVGTPQGRSQGGRTRTKTATAVQSYAQRLAGIDTNLFGAG